MADLIAGLIRWGLRVFLLLVGMVAFLGVLVLVLVLALVWGVRALWARLTGRSVNPWDMPLDPRAISGTVDERGPDRWGPNGAPSYPSAPRARGMGAEASEVTDVTEVRETPGEWPESQFSRFPTDDVTDVQPREPRKRS